jgi:D-glycero-alpha-D-manno-heptose-7-phosphate kinase
MIIRARSPLRLGLAGGGTDVSPFCDQFGGAVLNVTIDLYAYAIIEPAADGRVVISAPDIEGSGEIVDDHGALAGKLILHRAVYRRFVSQFNAGRPLPCRITTFCDAPPGSGLGTSSTMVVALVKAFSAWLNLPLGDYEIARLAFEIERQDAGLGGGRQDQYAATFGGVNFMEFFSGEKVIVNPLRISNWILAELETSLLLFDSGVSRASARIIREQTENLRNRTGTTLTALHEIKADAIRMKEFLLKGDFKNFAAVMRDSWDAKKRLAGAVSNPHIDATVAAAMEAGALAGKISGAGGGGVLTFLVAPERRVEVIRALRRREGQVLTCHLTRRGTDCWKIGETADSLLNPIDTPQTRLFPILTES